MKVMVAAVRTQTASRMVRLAQCRLGWCVSHRAVSHRAAAAQPADLGAARLGGGAEWICQLGPRAERVSAVGRRMSRSAGSPGRDGTGRLPRADRP